MSEFGSEGAFTSIPYAYPGSSHRLSSVDGLARSYDANGNTTYNPQLAWPIQVYDERNRLTRVQSLNEMAIDYQYNGAGKRVLKSDPNAQPVSYFYGPAGELLQSKQSFGLTVISTTHLYLGQTPVGVLTGMGAPMPVETDHLGTPRAVIDPARNTTIWRWELVTGDASQGGSNAFGDRPANEDPDGDESIFRYDLRFPGQQYDAETGLHYNYYRDYEPSTGRYVQSDPIGLDGGISSFGYTLGSPLRFSDAFGLLPCLTTYECACIRDPRNCAATPVPPGPRPLPLPLPVPDVNTENCPGKCKDSYPDYQLCYEVAGKYPYASKKHALLDFPVGSRPGGVRPAYDDKGCNKPGSHITYKYEGVYAGSVFSCKCCTDTGGGPVIEERWGHNRGR